MGLKKGVVPLAGTWIETVLVKKVNELIGSFPSRERGLKRLDIPHKALHLRRSPRGNVD